MNTTDLPSPQFVELAKKMLTFDEGKRSKAYQCTAGFWTVGVGRNLQTKGLSEVEQKTILGELVNQDECIEYFQCNDLTDFACDFLLGNDIVGFYGKIDKALPYFHELDTVRKLAILNIGFNLGIGGLMKFKRALGSLAHHQYKESADHFLDSAWAKQVPQRAERVTRMIATGELHKVYTVHHEN